MDEIDIRIIQELIANARVTYRELADRLDLSVNSVHKRVQRLVELGIIKEFTVHLTQAAQPHVHVRVCGTSATAQMDDTVARLGRNPNVAMVAVSSSNGMHIIGVLENAAELGRFVDFAVKDAAISGPTVRLLDYPCSRAVSDVSLSALDYRIVASLLHDSRKQAVDIGAELGVSAKTVKRHLERMEKNGIIYYQAVFDHASLGGTFTLIDLHVKDGVDTDEAVALIRKKYSACLLDIRTFSTLPNNVTIDAWTRTTTDLKKLHRSLMDEGIFENVIPIFVYAVYHFDTWRDDYIIKKALGN